MKDIKVKDFVLNKLTKAKYKELQEAGNVNPTELYLITDDAEGDYVLRGEVYTNSEVDGFLAKKQDKLSQVDLDNIAMINQYGQDISNLKSNKLDKVAEQEKVYATDGLGGQTTLQYNVEAIGGGLAKRGSNGTLKVEDPVDDKDAANKKYVDGKVTGVYVFKGSKPTFAELPKDGNNIGDVWDVVENGKNYAWTGSEWDDLGGKGSVDLKDYYKKNETYSNTEADDKFYTKIDAEALDARVVVLEDFIQGLEDGNRGSY